MTRTWSYSSFKSGNCLLIEAIRHGQIGASKDPSYPASPPSQAKASTRSGPCGSVDAEPATHDLLTSSCAPCAAKVPQRPQALGRWACPGSTWNAGGFRRLSLGNRIARMPAAPPKASHAADHPITASARRRSACLLCRAHGWQPMLPRAQWWRWAGRALGRRLAVPPEFATTRLDPGRHTTDVGTTEPDSKPSGLSRAASQSPRRCGTATPV